MKKLITAVLCTAALIPATSYALHKTGESVLNECETAYKENRCKAYILGTHDAHNTLVIMRAMEPHFCVPVNATPNQLQKILVKYMNENPEELHFVASSLVMEAFNKAFPPSFESDGTRYCPE